jgi:DNA-binding CsgD family transcriptional regulator
MTLLTRRLARQTGRIVRGSAFTSALRTVGWAPVHLALRRSGCSLRDALVPAAVGGAVVIVDLTASELPGGGAFLLLLLPVLLCAALLGTSHGIAALLLGAAGAILLALARGHPWLGDPLDLARLALYLVLGTGITVAAGSIPDRDGRPVPRPSARLDDTGPARELVEPLTPRELEILRLAAEGRSVDNIGRQLYLSSNTVKSHLAHAYGKLGARNRAQAIALSVRAGVLDPGALGEPD